MDNGITIQYYISGHASLCSVWPEWCRPLDIYSCILYTNRTIGDLCVELSYCAPTRLVTATDTDHPRTPRRIRCSVLDADIYYYRYLLYALYTRSL